MRGYDRETIRSNRTFMELKWSSSWETRHDARRSNRTFMELKYQRGRQNRNR